MFLNDPSHRWTQYRPKEAAQTSVYYKGALDTALSVLKTDLSAQEITVALKGNENFSSAIIETDEKIIAYVDHIRSWALFFSCRDGQFSISNNARFVREHWGLDDVDDVSFLEFSMSGYVSGDATVYDSLKCLQPGEFLVWDKVAKTLNTHRYHHYHPNLESTNNDWDVNQARMGGILDDLTRKVMARAGGRPIWIPLSGGLDSRILLCKLHEHGCRNIHTFTYGPQFNFEAKIAKKVAQKLGVPWIYVCPSKSDIRRYFNSDDRKKFWDTTDGLKAISSMREFSALMWLREHNKIPDDAIIVNGQSGDYITGNHISKKWTIDKAHRYDDLIATLIGKHYDLWSTLKSDENLKTLETRIARLLPSDTKQATSGVDFARAEEIWEYDARQICLVANGQRSYDYFGYDWEMPLWEKPLVDFCEQLPLKHKLGQSLYKKYLKSYNYKNLFPENEPYIWRWPLLMMWVVPFAQIVGLVQGRKAKDDFYALMRYHGHYSNQFYSYPWGDHKKTYDISRNVMALNVRHWAIENKEIVPHHILDAMRVDA